MPKTCQSEEQDQRLLHTLSLAIGKSLDPRRVASDFTDALRSHVPGCHAGLWWTSGTSPDELERQDFDARLPPSPSLYRTITHLKNPHFLSSSDPEFTHFSGLAAATCLPAAALPITACALYPLARQGVLALFASTTAVLTPLRSPEFYDLVDRLSIATQGARAHRQLRRSALPATPPDPEALSPITQALVLAMLRAAPDVVWLKDPDGRYLTASRRFERCIGHPLHEIIGRTDDDFVGPERARAFREKDREAIAAGKAITYEEWNTFANDSHSECLEKTKVPLFDANGEVLGVLGVGHDITERKKSEERSRHLAAMLRLMCDNVPDMIWAKDLDNNYLFANKALCTDLLNATDVNEPLGKSDRFFADRERQRHPLDPLWNTSFDTACLESDLSVLEYRKPFVFVECGHAGGKALSIEIHKSPFIDADGKIIGTVGSARDITDRRRIEEELEEYRHHLEELVEQRTNALFDTETRASNILQSTADGLYGIDTRGDITFINRAACEMLGCTEEDAIGKNAHALFHHHHSDGRPYAQEECPAHHALARGDTLRSSEEIYWHADGHPIPVMFALHPTSREGVTTGAVLSFIDITEQRASAQAREKALIAAENLARMKSQFLANMSHEIRTPLNGVLGFAQIGMRTYFDAAKAHNAFEKILSSGTRLLGIVNDVLDFSKIEAGKLSITKETVSLFDVIDHAIELVAERAAAKKIELTCEKSQTLPATCTTDGLRLEQILLNLLSNAVKFTDSGKVKLSCWQKGERLGFRVSDTGIGIADSEIEQIFNPFHQGDASATRRFGGAGLGLAICKHILELMGGTIEAKSQPAVGSRFEFHIPYLPATSDLQSTSAAMAPRQNLAGLTILAVEDDPTSANVLEQCLRHDGATVVMAMNGREAVEHVRRAAAGAFDLVLMDIQMPLMDGYEATLEIKKHAPDLLIIGQSAHVFGDEKAQCFACGMAAYIAKPINFEELAERIHEHLPQPSISR